MYTLSNPVNVNESSRKQIEFIPKAYGVKVQKTYNLGINTDSSNNEGLKFTSTFVFLNSKGNKMGIPLPAGTIRVFKEDDADHSLEFIGESSIWHIPRD